MLPSTAIILAGGKSRRMGTPKAALVFGSETILEALIIKLGSAFSEILVMAAPREFEAFPIEQMLQRIASSTHLLRDPSPHLGPAAALAWGLARAANDVAFACSCDLPLLRAETASALHCLLNGYDAVVPDLGGKPQPLCAVYRRSVATVIETQLRSGERRLTRIIAGITAYRPKDKELQQIDPGLQSFVNINTPEDYSRALALKRLPAPGKVR